MLLGDILGLFNGGQDPFTYDGGGSISNTGLLGALGRWGQNNASMLMQGGLGMMGSLNPAQGFAQGAQEGIKYDTVAAAQRKKLLEEVNTKNAYQQYFAGNKDLAPMANLAAADPAFAREVASTLATRDPLERQVKLAQLQLAMRKLEGKDANYGLNPVWGTDDKGNPIIGQLSDQGGIRVVQTPEGFRFGKDPIRIDAGTHWQLLDPVTRTPIGVIPKNKEEAAAQTATGTKEGEAIGNARTALPAVEDSVAGALEQMNGIRTHPGIDWGTGGTSWTGNIWGSNARDFQNRVEQVKSGAFLQAYNTLKGAGAITDIEGQKATAALNRMNVTTSKKEFLDAMKEYESVLQVGLARMRKMAAGQFEGGRGGAGGTPGIPGAPASTPPAGGSSDPLGIR